MRIGTVLTTAFSAFMIAGVAAAAPAAHGPGINQRQQRQASRIRDGVASGEVTRGELNRLRADEAAIRGEERVYRRSGDGLTPREARDLQRDLNQTSREIARARHNDNER